VRKGRGSPPRISVSAVRRSQENATPRGDATLADPGGRMLTARSGPLGLGVPRTLGPAEGSDHLFLLPERALVMDSTHLRQDLAGLDFNLHLNLLHTAPRGNVWLCELLSDVPISFAAIRLSGSIRPPRKEIIDIRGSLPISNERYFGKYERNIVSKSALLVESRVLFGILTGIRVLDITERVTSEIAANYRNTRMSQSSMSGH